VTGLALKMRRHVEQLCRDNGITWRPCLKRCDNAHAISLIACERYDIPREIITAPIRSVISYAVALHEIGHYLGRYQRSARTITRETWAWEWARQNALIWTLAMERRTINDLAFYTGTNGKEVPVGRQLREGEP